MTRPCALTALRLLTGGPWVSDPAHMNAASALAELQTWESHVKHLV